MTSELKPNYEKFSREICQIAFEGCDADGGSIQDIGVKHGVLREETFNHKKHSDVVNAEYFEDGQTVYCFVAPRAVPDVPELVRYRLHWSDFDTADMEVDSLEGEYVRYDQAAAIIAAKVKLGEQVADKIFADYTTQLLLKEDAVKRAEAAEAELAQIKAQEPVAWQHRIKSRQTLLVDFPNWTKWQEGKCNTSNSDYIEIENRPLYAAPVDQTAEIERYRETLNKIASYDGDIESEAHAFCIESAFVALSGKEPS